MVCGDVWWFVVVCGSLLWFAVVCLLFIPVADLIIGAILGHCSMTGLVYLKSPL